MRRMVRSKILWRLYGGFAVVILLVTGGVGMLVGSFVERETLREVDRTLEDQAQLLHALGVGALGNAVLRETDVVPDLALQHRVEELGRALTTRLTVIAADGGVLADSDADPKRMDNHGTRPEVLEAAERGVGWATRYSRTVRQEMRYFAMPLRISGTSRGFVRTSLPLTVLAERLADLRRLILVAAGIATLGGLTVGWLLARRFTRPLAALTTSAEAIARGAYGQRVPVASRDELGRLASAFNTMSQGLEQAVATAEADRNQLRAILASMAEGVVAVDRDERIVHLNRTAGRLLGLGDETVGRPIWEATRIVEASEMLGATLEREEVGHRVVRLPDSPDRYLELHASPWRDTDGGLEGAVLLAGDITHLRRLENLRRDFVGNVSHELKTPVTAIRGLVETLLDDPEAPPSIRSRFLGKALKQAERLSNLVTDLLSLTRLESEEQPLQLEPLDVRWVLEESVLAQQPNAEARGVRVAQAWDGQPLLVDGEEEALRQAVGNLLSNAIKFSPEGGLVEVRAHVDEGAGLEVGRFDQVTIEVADEGPGIDARHHARLFERFYRVDAARSRELGGTGLGLAIVKHIALALGGEVEVESKVGAGATFRIHLPASREAVSGTIPLEGIHAELE